MHILQKCAWTPNFSHFGWDITKINTVPTTMPCPENDVYTTMYYYSSTKCPSTCRNRSGRQRLDRITTKLKLQHMTYYDVKAQTLSEKWDEALLIVIDYQAPVLNSIKVVPTTAQHLFNPFVSTNCKFDLFG